ncbi:redoxin domain-containing protein [Candidatus Uhrbacteria bacterium]|nr:redoxin domain-containing protein [Candidatus Uhrbacteria bacterium]
MKRPVVIALVILGILVIAAIATLSRGPMVLTKPEAPMPPNGRRIVSVPDMGEKIAPLPIYNVTMPEFRGITKWWNTADGQSLTPEKLRGKVVIIDFWTYSCINCIRTYPFLRSMHEKYADKGLVIVGVHTPEFAFEADPKNVGREIEKNGLKYPIALDPDFATWNAYSNRYWPAEYFFDRQGRLRRTHFGEGEYGESELAIRSLLEEDGVELSSMGETETMTPDFSKIKTPETYFGLLRGQEFMGTPGTNGTPVTLTASEKVEPNRWTAGGSWTFTPEYTQSDTAGAIFRFSIQANKLHLVLEAADGKDKMIEIFVDGIKTGEITINESDLYDIAEFPDAGRHTVELRLKDEGVRFYAATFS